MKKLQKIKGLFLLIVFAGLFFACKTEREDTINLALFKSPASEKLIKLIPEFENKTGITVKYDILPYSDLKTKIEQQFMIRSGNYDIIMADCIWIPSFAERGFLALVDTTLFDDDYDFEDLLPALDDYLGRYPQNGPRYGMPFMSNTHMLTYRRDIVEPVVKSLGYELPGRDAESAWTWQQYKEIAVAITEKHRDDGIYGTSLQARAGAWIIYEWYSVLFGFVSDLDKRKTGLPEFNEETKRAIQFYADLYRKAAPREALTWGHEEETSAICSGRCAMDATSNVELASIFFAQDCDKDNLEFAFPPIGESGLASPDMGGYGLMLNNFSRNLEQATKFLGWATGKETHTEIVLGGGTPIRKSQISNTEILEKYPYLDFYDDLIATSVYRARIPEWPEFEDVLSRELVLVMRGERSAEAANDRIRIWISANIK